MVPGMNEPDPSPPWADAPVHLVASDPTWPAIAAGYIAEINALLGSELVGTPVHIGSTAIPALPAKPIIDLQALATDPSTVVADHQEALAASSWFLVPPELDQRSWRWFFVRADPTGQHRLAHLHLMRVGEPRWHQQLAFRDRLRTSPDLAREYYEIKSTAAAMHTNDREAYTHLKHDFVHRVLNTTAEPPADGGASSSRPGGATSG